MDNNEVLHIFREAGAILEGHFILTSGRHSSVYMQKAKVFMHANLTAKLCKALAGIISSHISNPIDYLVGPAIGGLIPAYETSRHMDIPAIWVERVAGKFLLKRFEIAKGARIVIIEDIVTTGVSIRETIDAMRMAGAEILAAACIIDRSGGKVDVGVPLISLCSYMVPSYAPDELPPTLATIPPVKPGSRNN